MHFKHGPVQRQYNEPTYEVAAVLVGQDRAPSVYSHIIVYPRDRPPQ